MSDESKFLTDRLEGKAEACIPMQIVFLDIVAFSRRTSERQIHVVRAFQKIIRKALAEITIDFGDPLKQRNANMAEDAVILPTGDGVVIGIPFVDIKEFALHLGKMILAKVDTLNKATKCDKLLSARWCNCHDGFFIRCGISEGTTILYRDLNQRFNLAGTTINLASRVMDLADSNQIFLTQRAFEELTDFTGACTDDFNKYLGVPIKHGDAITVYQCIASGIPGLDTEIHDGLCQSNTVGVSSQSAKPSHPQGKSDLAKTNSEIIPASLAARKSDRQTIQEEIVSPSLKQPSFVSELEARMRRVSGGTFTMGAGTARRLQVNITRPFRIDPYLVTQELYNQVTGYRHCSRFHGERHPVDSVSWIEAVTFCNSLSDVAGFAPVYQIQGHAITANISRNGYRLPTEAEWEYCCCGCGVLALASPLDKIAWFGRNAQETTHPVGELEANPCGLYDMLGNLWEWCQDWYAPNFPDGAVDDYSGPLKDEMERVLRGGSWIDIEPVVTPYYRNRAVPTLKHKTYGFRIARTDSR